MQLAEFFHDLPRAALAFSGGVDSAYLLYAALQHGCAVEAFFVHSPFQPQFELEDAKRLAEQLGATLHVVACDILQQPLVAENGSQRCYHCKRALFEQLLAAAREQGFDLLMDGSNASDAADDRPGMRALAELGVRSPLRECGLDKAAIRRLSRQAGLFTHNKPAYACLATRIPTGTAILPEDLERVERGEAALAAMGFSDLRLRVTGSGARLELPVEQMPRVVEQRQQILETLRPWFAAVALDLAGRRSD